MASETATNTTTTATSFVDTYIDNSKHLDDTEIINKLATFSDDDDTCSFDSEQDEKLLTPPITEDEEQECQQVDDKAIDWGNL